MTLVQLFAALLILGVLLTAAASFDVFTLLDNFAVSMAGTPVWRTVVEPLL